jgi:hypothetical protein
VEIVKEVQMPRLLVEDYLVPGHSARYLGRSDPYRIDKVPRGWSLPAARAHALRLYLFPPSAAPWGIDGSYDVDVPGIDPPMLAVVKGLAYELEDTPAGLRLLQLGAVTHVVSLHERPGLATARVVSGLFPEPIRVSTVPDPLPRALVVGNTVVPASDDEAVRALLDGAFDLRRTAILADGPVLSASPAFAGTGRIRQRLADTVIVEAISNEPACVVLVDAFHQGWRAWVDGRPAPVRRANGVFRGVCIDAGRRTVDLRYRPPAVRVGLALTVVGLGLAALLGWRTRRRVAA